MSFYLSLSRMLGFREKLSLILMFIFGGALLGYCLAKSFFMDSKKRMELTTAGELFWFNRAPYKATYIIHIFLSILGGIFVGSQFIPAIRRQFMFFHRINGYFCILTIGLSNIAGAVVARRSFGGELNVQSAYWTLAIMSTLALTLGIWYVRRDTRKHRRWMLKGVVYFAAVITGRLTMMAANAIITLSGEYSVPWRCDELFSVLNDTKQLSRLYPECQTSGNTLVNPTRSVTVHCSVHEGSLGIASCERATHGMGLWVALLLHVVGVEIYLRCTERANYQKMGYVLEPRDSVQSDCPQK
ncbi:hypothetical protein L218DRAFT_729626 [Marasmius fiardii PR-910]|nr:hypothetical protein L218DRAFT_729626 [Marasmius fiardii PR-910]